MGAVLLAAIVAAWLIGLRPRRHVRAAEDILASMRSQGLAKYWPEKLHTQWYLVYSGQAPTPVGWRAAVRGRTEAGLFVGLTLRVTADRYDTEIWVLNSDATASNYEARTGVLTRLGINEKWDVKISLRDGVVTVEPNGGGRASAHSPAAKNYLPEGTWELAISQVAAKRGGAYFEGVFNSSPNYKGQVEFVTMRLRCTGEERTAEGKAARWVRLLAKVRAVQDKRIVSRKIDWEYLVGPDGEILRAVRPWGRLELSTQAEVRAAFPDVKVRAFVGGFVGRFMPAELVEAWHREEAPPERNGQ